MSGRLAFLTVVSLLAFAGNSLLCRIALKLTSIDPMSFNTLRIASGAAVLWLVVSARQGGSKTEGNWVGAAALFTYAMAFAFAYSGVPAGIGALLLFGSIQVTMILWGLALGERLSGIQLLGLGFAVGGLVVLLWPTASAPPLGYGAAMILSGVAWGVYSLVGRGARDAAAATAGNFIRATPLALAFYLAWSWFANTQYDLLGLGYAVLSGAVTSGLGYICWYAAVKRLKVTHAATVQLSVPLIATVGGVLILGEAVTQVLFFASVAVLFGIALVIFNPALALKRA